MVYCFLSIVFPLLCVVAWTGAMSAFHYEGDIQECYQEMSNSSSSSNSSSCEVDHSSSNSNNNCWEGYTEAPYLLILSVPMIIALAVSAYIFTAIIAVYEFKSCCSCSKSASTYALFVYFIYTKIPPKGT